MKLRTQLALGVTFVAVVVIGLAGLVIAVRIQDRDLAQVDQDLATRATKTEIDACKAGADNGNRSTLSAGSQSLVRVLSGGVVLAEYGDIPPAAIPPPTTGYSTVLIGDQRWRSYAADVPCGQIQILNSLVPVDERLVGNEQVIIWVAVAAAALICLGVWLVAGLVLSPLQRLRVGAARIRTGHDLEHRLPPVRQPLEVAELSDTLNDMLDGLHASMLSTRRFTADAGHELRTPLASLGIDLESLRRNPDLPTDQRRAMLVAMAREHARIVDLLDGLQALARGDASALPARAPVDVGDVVDGCVALAARQHPHVQYRVQTGPQPLPPVSGWREGLQVAVRNLLDNAAVHGSHHVEVAVFTTRPGTISISVSDDGPGIPADVRDEMKGRFVRGADTSASGSGLGLALVDQQVSLHGGKLELGESASGGLRATMELPRP